MFKYGCDIDDVFSDFLVGFSRFCLDRFQLTLTEDDFREYDLWGLFRDHNLSLDQVFADFYYSYHFTHMPLVPGSAEAVNNLFRNERAPIFISSRSPALLPDTQDYLRRHLVFAPEIILVGSIGETPSRSKVQVCHERGLSYLIEDRVDTARDCACSGINVLLFDRPWNKDLLDSRLIKRVRSWGEIESYIKGIKGEIS